MAPTDGEKEQGLTKYQGEARRYGSFYCRDCKRHWNSANSWANKGQKCKSCDRNIYPYKQTPLRKSKFRRVDLNKEHPQDMCEKCKELGYYCRKLKTKADDEDYVSDREDELMRKFGNLNI